MDEVTPPQRSGDARLSYRVSEATERLVAPDTSIVLVPLRHLRKEPARQLALLRARPHLQLALALLLGFAVRLFVLLRSNGMFDGDEAVLGIQGENILRGAHPLYFYGQSDTGSWEAYLAAPLIALFGPSAAVLHAVTLAESLVLIPLLGALAARLYGPAARLPAYLLAVLPPLYVASGELRLLGGYVETLVLGTALLLLAVEVADVGGSARRQRWLWALAGLLAGLALWIDAMIVYYLVTLALWGAPLLLARAWHARANFAEWLARVVRQAGAAAVAFVLGISPAILYASTHQLANVRELTAPAPYIPQLGVLRLPILGHFMVFDAPQALGIQLLWGIPTNTMTQLLSLLTLGGILLALSDTVSRLIVSEPRISAGFQPENVPIVTRSHLTPRLRAALPGILVVVIVLIFWRSAMVISGIVGGYTTYTARYLIPLTTAFTLMFAGFYVNVQRMPTWPMRASFVSNAMTRALSQGAARQRRRRILGLLLAASFIAIQLGANAVPYVLADGERTMQSPYVQKQRFPAEQRQLLTYIEQQHIHAIWGNHWIGQPIIFLEDGRVICADYVDVKSFGGRDRVPGALAAVASADRASFLVESDEEPRLFADLKAIHVAYTSARFGRIWLVTPITRTVQPFEVLAALVHDE